MCVFIFTVGFLFCLFIQCSSLHLLIEVFRPFTLNVIIDTVRITSIILLFSICPIHSLFLFSIFLPFLDWFFLILFYSFYWLMGYNSSLLNFSSCFRVYSVHFKFITDYLQATLYCFTYNISTLQQYNKTSLWSTSFHVSCAGMLAMNSLSFCVI